MEFLFYKIISLLKLDCKFKVDVQVDELISPVHLFMFYIFTLPILLGINKQLFFLIFIQYIVHTQCYYKLLTKEKKINIWQSIKNDFPTFSKIDMSFGQMILFLLIASPFLLFVGSIIVAMFD